MKTWWVWAGVAVILGCTETRHRYPDGGTITDGSGTVEADEVAQGDGAVDAAADAMDGSGGDAAGQRDADGSDTDGSDADGSDADGSDADGSDAEGDGSGGGIPGGLEFAYAHVPPPGGAIPAALASATWLAHLEEDLLPFWTTADALGVPPGNYPTYRGMNGKPQIPTTRRPRMMGRQIYLYCMSYLLTGDEMLLEHAAAGVSWLLEHAWDAEHGGWHAQLDAAGEPIGGEAKTAQDAAYAALGLAAWWFVTRDPGVESALLATRDLLMEGPYWDAGNGRIRDAMTPDLSAEVDVESDGGWELVAQLDAINAFLLLSQPVLSEPARREQALADLERLGHLLVDEFFQEGIFWGVHNQKGSYGGKHVDFGHTLKSYWMLAQLDKRLPTHPFESLLESHLGTQLERAFDAERQRWGKRPTSATAMESGSDWWIWAECDQLAATVDLLGGVWRDRLASTGAHWMADFVDTTRPVRELVPSIDQTGEWVFPWPDTDTAKCNQWKSGFHGAEHALVMYLHGTWLEDAEASLHFAPLTNPEGFIAPPYVFHGTEVARQSQGSVTIAGKQHTEVVVRYGGLW